MVKYRVGVIGAGGIGNRHVSGLVDLDHVELVSVCDISEEALNGFKKKWESTWSNISLYTNYTKMLTQENLDIVTVATPDNYHADPVVEAANVGVKGIFCEKPMATTLIDADRMLEAVDKNSCLLSIDHTRRFTSLWHHIKSEIIANGEIGELQYITGTLSGRRASIFRNGTHLIDALCYLADSAPDWVFAELETGYENYTEYRGDGGRDPKLEPSASGYIHFKNDVRAFYAGTSKNTAGPKWRFEIMGSQAYIQIEKGAKIFRKDSIERIEPPKWEIEGISAGARDLVLALDENREVASPAKEALHVVEIIHGFLKSQQRGNTKIHLPLTRA